MAITTKDNLVLVVLCSTFGYHPKVEVIALGGLPVNEAHERLG
jgi:hypothetical protein